MVSKKNDSLSAESQLARSPFVHTEHNSSYTYMYVQMHVTLVADYTYVFLMSPNS